MECDQESVNYSFSDRFNMIIKSLTSGTNSTLPVIFILDELDLIAQHSKQLLLYNLFDISQSSSSPVCVIGLTSRMDALNLLEKRVKSRFSHRMIDFYPCKTFDDYVNIAKSALLLQDSSELKLADCGFDQDYVEKFNEAVEDLFQMDGRDVLNDWFDISNDIPSLLKICSHVIQSLTPSNPFPSISSMTQFIDTIDQDARSSIVQGI